MEVLAENKAYLRVEAKLDCLMAGNAAQDVRLAVIETKLNGSLMELAGRLAAVEDRVSKLESSVAKLVAYASVFSAGGSALMTWAINTFLG
jgi:hypothetical protein